MYQRNFMTLFFPTFRGSLFPKKRGNRGNNFNRPIRNIQHYQNSLQKEKEIHSNEISIEEPFSYQSSAEFESSNEYKTLKTKPQRGYYYLP